MTKFAQGFWGFLTARSTTAGRKRMAGVFIAWWALFWAASVLSPCCDILATAVAHDQKAHSTAAGHDVDRTAGDHAPRPQCTTIVDVDMALPNAVPLLVALLELPDALWAPSPTVPPVPIRQSGASHLAYAQPPPLPPLYLRTSRLLI